MEDNELLKAIAQIVQAETKPIKDDLTDIKTRLSTVEEHVGSIDKRLINVEDHVGGIDKRLINVEDHVGGMESDIARTKLLLEHDIPKQINILAEGHSAILERLPEADELDSLRSRVRTLEHVVTEHTQEISVLKHASN